MQLERTRFEGGANRRRYNRPMDNPPLPEQVSLPLKTFLTMPDCPARWRHFDLYMVSGPEVVFYVGQSHCAFERVWEHIRGGPHGHAILGRLVLVNWPKSAGWTVTLLSAQSPRFDCVHRNLDAAERMLIEELVPCLNVSLNREPAPLPDGCLPANAPFRGLKSYKRMIREAGYMVRAVPNETGWGEES